MGIFRVHILILVSWNDVLTHELKTFSVCFALRYVHIPLPTKTYLSHLAHIDARIHSNTKYSQARTYWTTLVALVRNSELEIHIHIAWRHLTWGPFPFIQKKIYLSKYLKINYIMIWNQIWEDVPTQKLVASTTFK